MYPVYLITCNHPGYGMNIMPYIGCVLTEGKTIDERFDEHLRGAEFRKRMTGRTAWNKGLKGQGSESWTPERKLAISQRMLGNTFRSGKTPWNKGKFGYTVKTQYKGRGLGSCPKQSKAMKALWADPVYREKRLSARHTRWHVNRGIKKEGCALCQ